MSSLQKNSKAKRQSKAQSDEKSRSVAEVDISSEFDALVSMIDSASVAPKTSQKKRKRPAKQEQHEQIAQEADANATTVATEATDDTAATVATVSALSLSDEQDSAMRELQDLADTVSGASSEEAVDAARTQHQDALLLHKDGLALDAIDASVATDFGLASVSLDEDSLGHARTVGTAQNTVAVEEDNEVTQLSKTEDMSSSIVADESTALDQDIFGQQSPLNPKQRESGVPSENEGVLSKAAKELLNISSEGKLQHVSGKTFELSTIFPDIKLLSSTEQTRLNKEFMSGIAGPISQLLNGRYLERLGGSEFGLISVDKIKELIAKTQGELDENAIVKLHALFNDLPIRHQLIKQIKRSEGFFELQGTNVFDVEKPLTLLAVSEEQLTMGDMSQEVLNLRRHIVQTYMKHEEHILNAIKSYKFDPTTTEYQELVFYYYLLASQSNDVHFFNIYHKLVDLQNLYLIFKLFVGSFINDRDISIVFHGGDVNKIASYSAPLKVDMSKVDIAHFLYLRTNLKHCLEAEAPYYLGFFDKLSTLTYQDTKRTYFSEGLPFDFGFIPSLKSYLLAIVADFIGKDSLENFERMDADADRRSMMYYDIFFRQNQEYLKRLPEFDLAQQDIGGSIQNAIKNNEITPKMREWAFHVKHQVDIFKTMDRLEVDSFDIFHHHVLNYCSPLYIQLYYQQLAFYSKYKLNIKRKRDFVQNLTVTHLNLLNHSHYIEALSSEYTQEAKTELRSMLAQRRGLFAHADSVENHSHTKGKKSERTKDYDLEQATAVLGATTLGILREGSTTPQDALVSVEEMEILSNLRLEQSELKTLRQLVKAGFKRLYSEHLTGKTPMDLDKGQFIGDYGAVPIIPGVSAHTAFLIARALHFGDFGLKNQQMSRLGFFYADLSGHYLASMFVVNLYSVLFDSNLGLQGNLYGAYLIRAVFAGLLTADSDENLYRQQYHDVHQRLYGFLHEDGEQSQDKESRHKDSSNQGNFASFVQQASASLVVHLGSTLAHRSSQVQRLINVFKNGVSIFLKPDYGDTYYQSLATLSQEHYALFKQLNPNFSLHHSFEGEVLQSYNQFQIILSNALIFILDSYDEHLSTSDAYTPVLHGLLGQLYALMGQVQSPYGCLALFKYLSINKSIEMARIDKRFERFFDAGTLSKLIYVQLFSRRDNFNNFDNHCDEFNDISQIGNIFWQLAMCLPDLREQGYNLLDRNLNSLYGNFYPCRFPVMDEFVKTSAALQNGNSLSYMTAINHQMGNHELADLFALIANNNFSFKAYKDIVRYCIKHDLHELRLAFAQQMVLLRQPYAYYEMFLCCKDLPERQLEAHTYLYFASLLNVAEAKRDLRDLQRAEQFKPLPFLVYYLYLQEIAQDDLSALLCLMILTIDNGLVPANFSDFAKMLENFTGCFSNSQLKRVLSSYGLLNNISNGMAYHYSSFYSIFPETENEAVQSGGEAINGNFDYLMRLLTFMDVNESNYVGGISLESCDAKVRVILGKMFEKLSNGKTFLERLLQVSWSRSQAFPSFLRDQYKDLIDDTLVISSHMDPAVFEIINNWVANSFDPYNSTLDTGWCIAVRQDHPHNRDLESFCESLWLNHEIYPSRNLILSAVLLSLRSVRGRPYPRIFRALCRYLANSGENVARRYTQLEFDYLGIAPYGLAFEELVAKDCREQVCKLAGQHKGQSVAQIQEQAVKEQIDQYLKLHKEGLAVASLHPLPKSKASSKPQDEQVPSDMVKAQSLKQAQPGELKLDFDEQRQKRFEQCKVELNEMQERREGDDLALWGASDNSLISDESSGSSALDQNEESSSTGLMPSHVQIGDPGTWIGQELWGRNDLLNYAFYMQLHGRGSVMLDLLSVKNGWLLGRKANGPMRSYSYYLAKSLLKNEPGAFHRYLYYVQSHYFKYRLHEEFEGEDSKSATARKFVNDVLQFKLDSPKFMQFISEMRKEGIFDFDELISDAANGFIQGRYKFVGGSFVDKSAGWRDLFFGADDDLNLSNKNAINARESLKFLAAKIDHLSEVATGASLDQKTIDDLRYGNNKPHQGQDVTEGEQVDTVGLEGYTTQAKGFGEARLRMQYGAMQVSKELVKDSFIANFLGEDVERLTDASCSKQWINYTFYQEPYFNSKQDLLQMLPYTNSILEQCIQDNVGHGLMNASGQGSSLDRLGLVYEPRLIQWRSSKLRIKQEESFDITKVSPDMLLQRFEKGYDNALYQIDRTRFNLLRQAPVNASTVSAAIESQAVWATQLNKRAELLDQGKATSEGATRFEQPWQNTLVTEDGYDAMLEKRMQHACFAHSKITDDIFYVSEQNYYKELLNKVVGAAEKNPELLKHHGVLGVILERAGASYQASSEQAEHTPMSAHGDATQNKASATGANVNLFKLSAGKSEHSQEAQNLEQLIKMAASAEAQDKQLQDEVINENRSSEATLLNHLQSFLSEKMGDMVPTLEGAIKSDKAKLERNELDNGMSFISILFKNLWDFDTNAEQQYTRPKMFHEEESPFHTIIYSMVQEYMSHEELEAQIRFANTLMSRLHHTYGYFFGASDVVDSAFASVIIACFMRRYYREVSLFNSVQHVCTLICEYLSTMTEDSRTLDYLEHNIQGLTTLPHDMCARFNLPMGMRFKDFIDLYTPKFMMQQVRVDPHFKALATATYEQILHYPELMCDDSFINQALFDLLKDKELLEYSKAVDGDTGLEYISVVHKAIKSLVRLSRKGQQPKECSNSAPLPFVRAYAEVDLSLWSEVNDEGEAALSPSYLKQAEEYMNVLLPELQGDLSRTEIIKLQYFTPFECDNQREAQEQEQGYKRPEAGRKLEALYKGKQGGKKGRKQESKSANKQESKQALKPSQGVGDNFAPELGYNLFRAQTSPVHAPLFSTGEDSDIHYGWSEDGDDDDDFAHISDEDKLDMLCSVLSDMGLPYEQVEQLMADLMSGRRNITDLMKPLGDGTVSFSIPAEYFVSMDDDDEYDFEEYEDAEEDEDDGIHGLVSDYALAMHEQIKQLKAQEKKLKQQQQKQQGGQAQSQQGKKQYQGGKPQQGKPNQGKATQGQPHHQGSKPQQGKHNKSHGGKPQQGPKGQGKKR